MSMECKDKYGRTVGSEKYFRDLNAENYIGCNTKCNYYDTFGALTEKIHRAFDEIYDDLKSNCAIIRYIPQKDRDNLDHVNFEAVGEPNLLHSKIIKKYNHYPITDDAYKALTHMEQIGKQVRAAGKVLFVAGVVLDLLELGLAVNADLKNVEEKFAQRTTSTLAGIGGRWAGAIAGAQIGAEVRSLIGSVVPGSGTVIGGTAGALVLGVVGAISGDNFARWLLDVSCLED